MSESTVTTVTPGETELLKELLVEESRKARTQEFDTFQLAFDWIREVDRPVQFIVAADCTKSGKRELWHGFPSGRGEFIYALD